MNFRKIEPEVEEEDYLEFRVVHEDGSSGYVSLNLRGLQVEDHWARAADAQRIPVPEGSIVAEMMFYPHSETSPQRQGIGSRVLSFILEEARKRRIRIISAEYENLNSRDFFNNRGFSEVFPSQGYYFL